MKEILRGPFFKTWELTISGKASRWIIDDSFPDYLLKLEESLEKEKERYAHYLHSITEPKLVEVVQNELLVSVENQLLEKERSGCRSFLSKDRNYDLSRMFRLYHAFPKRLGPFADVFRLHAAKGDALIQQGIGNDSMAVGFALDLLLKRLKKSKLEELKQEEFFPLPSLTPEGDKYEGDRLLTKALSIAKPGSNITLTVSLSFFQLLSWFIRSNKMKTDQLTEVMKLPEFEDIESDQHYRALLLFEAMVEGRSMDTEIHEIATINSYKTATIYLPQAAFLHKAPY
ncbi:hypothetical protein F2Q68_00012418 [Brassica cretica]|uniref:Cullin N-terminal domain-containing protein n=1 Tax=Brassica cretica TaxID=69181 RepID=A0A8S9L332_BRACR|nr:hypothetical protein F2Q68_00012418 [Brassica cretica]